MSELLALDATNCTVEPAWPDGVAIVEAETGRCVILHGGKDALLKTLAQTINVLTADDRPE